MRSGTLDRVKYYFDLLFVANKGDIILMDESDVLIYESPSEFKKFISNDCPCICFTATLHGADIELSVLEVLKFRIFDYEGLDNQN